MCNQLLNKICSTNLIERCQTRKCIRFLGFVCLLFFYGTVFVQSLQISKLFSWPFKELCGFNSNLSLFPHLNARSLWRKFIVFHQSTFIFTLCGIRNTWCTTFSFFYSFSHFLLTMFVLLNKQKFCASWFYTLSRFSSPTFVHSRTHTHTHTSKPLEHIAFRFEFSAT